MTLIMIRPILPNLPSIQSPNYDVALQVLSFTVFLTLVGMIAFVLSLCATNKWNGDKKKTAIAFIGISLAIGGLLLCFFGCAVSAVRGMIFGFILVYCSYSDIKTREAENYLHVMIVLTALIGCEVTEIPSKILAAILITLPMLLIVIVCKGKTIGGADVKLSAACSFLLGTVRGFAGLMTGLTIAIIINLIIQMKKGKLEGFPLIPYLAASYMAAYFI